MHFYEFNIGDFAKKTQHLTNEEELAYRRLLDLYYDIEQPITHGLATLSRRLRVSEESLKNVLDEFFPEGKNKHADEKIAAYYAYIEKQKANGKQGGRPKQKPIANPPVSQNNPVPSQPLTTKPLTTKPNIKPLSEYSDDFEKFWKSYPKKTGKGGAYAKWKKFKPSLDTVLKALEWQKSSNDWTKENGQYIPNPETYLNQKRWDDENPNSKAYDSNEFMKRIGAV